MTTTVVISLLLITKSSEHTMLLHEILARARMREDQQRAARTRLSRRLATVRRWQRLAQYAEQRAHRAATRM